MSTIRNADEILVMKKGTLVERGTHQELLSLDGVYKKLVSNQIEEKTKEWSIRSKYHFYPFHCNILT